MPPQNGAGTGGRIDLQGLVVRVGSNLNANGGSNGDGGQINVSAHGTGNFLSVTNASISASAGSTAGSGGNIYLTGEDAVKLTDTALNANASSSGIGTGGVISVKGSTITAAVSQKVANPNNALGGGTSGNGGKFLSIQMAHYLSIRPI